METIVSARNALAAQQIAQIKNNTIAALAALVIFETFNLKSLMFNSNFFSENIAFFSSILNKYCQKQFFRVYFIDTAPLNNFF